MKKLGIDIKCRIKSDRSSTGHLVRSLVHLRNEHHEEYHICAADSASFCHAQLCRRAQATTSKRQAKTD
ncbi:hypothetical protein [Aulosira sp. FACHB-615]|uniref:hypothetical protein n=1 Tax=Aulosira sp. FACHB-615 TaxID=2692777 RepID=UPI001687DB09|nr:hypothetical protein [Aulosira sp. FACHB-615]MBD2488975.1 hypothetical protein [Aulosira sp. FACHB-615]